MCLCVCARACVRVCVCVCVSLCVCAWYVVFVSACALCSVFVCVSVCCVFVDLYYYYYYFCDPLHRWGGTRQRNEPWELQLVVLYSHPAVCTAVVFSVCIYVSMYALALFVCVTCFSLTGGAVRDSAMSRGNFNWWFSRPLRRMTTSDACSPHSPRRAGYTGYAAQPFHTTIWNAPTFTTRLQCAMHRQFIYKGLTRPSQRNRSALFTETKKHSPNASARANNTLQVARPPHRGAC